MTPDVTAVIAAYWPGSALDRCVDSLLASPNISSVVIVNNAAADREPSRVARSRSRVQVLEEETNAGFCAATNRALDHVSTTYVLAINQDAYITSGFVDRVADHLRTDTSLASASGLVLQTSGDGTPTGLVDSAGLVMRVGRRPEDISHGVKQPSFTPGSTTEVFGVSAAVAVYRMASLRQVAVHGQVFPEDFWMYFDDVDLAWRLRLMGYRSLVDLSAIAYHARAAAGASGRTSGLRRWIDTARQEMSRPDYVRERVWVNQLLMLIRNDSADSFLRQLPLFAVRRLPVESLLLAQRPDLAGRARIRFLRLLPAALVQRWEIQRRRIVGQREMDRWFR